MVVVIEEEMAERESVGETEAGARTKAGSRAPQGSQIDTERATFCSAIPIHQQDGNSQILIIHHASHFRIICSRLLELAEVQHRRSLLARAR